MKSSKKCTINSHQGSELQKKEVILQKDREIVYDEIPPFPPNMQMELTNICNHRCLFCGYEKMKRPRKKCDKELMFDVLKQAYELGTREVGFYMIGEPFILDDVDDYVRTAKNLGYTYIYITTNGTLANIEKVKKCYEAGLDSIKYSINGSNRYEYKKMHGRDDFDKVKRNVIELNEYKKKNAIKDLGVFISFIKTEWNKNNIDELYQEYGELVDKIYVWDCKIQGGWLDTESMIHQGIISPESLESLGGGLPCGMLFNRFHVTCEGLLDACCVDFGYEMAVADLREISLAEAWRSDVMREIRRKHLQGEINGTYCYNCVFLKNEKTFPINQALAEKRYFSEKGNEQ
ncbi:radical SAM protein [Lachnospiraceae bacterium]|jgi:organic radical activating enzyme|nr:radical SAM/SPASM domain-containing protein [uncultured Schaedlerella sp.]EOS39508.1 hypothetical protein C808_01933 [Lachnospiraceae bacterium M18-1]MCI9152304.1 radical SAM protein [Ruminococcus sp.]NBI57564.1 radical SAM protein [Lachnospiraceae bacterium]